MRRKQEFSTPRAKNLIIELFQGHESVKRATIIKEVYQEHLNRDGRESNTYLSTCRTALKQLGKDGIVTKPSTGHYSIEKGIINNLEQLTQLKDHLNKMVNIVDDLIKQNEHQTQDHIHRR